MEPQSPSTSAEIRLNIQGEPAPASLHQLPSYGEALQAPTLPPKDGSLPPAYINTTVLEAGSYSEGTRIVGGLSPAPKREFSPCQTCFAIIIVILCFAAVVAINVLLDMWAQS